MNIQGRISRECYYKFRNLIILRHGLTQGSISFELERALHQYMGEKVLDVLINDNESQAEKQDIENTEQSTPK
jgi:hypothetical protein